MRENMGKSQSDFAGMLGVPARTYIKWERGERNPGEAALSLLKIVIAAPDQAFKILAASH
ncbi:MAG: helix-turn-helix domain-containing protein [Planctomycetes bacterium]|nr:helix-turn-helix domain-containing protein [Planctomycetota bacterium]